MPDPTNNTQTQNVAVINEPWRAGTAGAAPKWRHTVNPFASLLGLTVKYPEWLGNMFAATGNPNAQSWAATTANAAGSALLFAAIMGGARGIQHLNRMKRLRDEDDPSRRIEEQLGTTFSTDLNKTASQEVGVAPAPSPAAAPTPAPSAPAAQAKPGVPTAKYYVTWPKAFSAETVFNAAIPLAAALGAGGLAWKGMDYLADKHRNKMLGQAIDAKSNVVRRLMQTRARIAKGTITPEEVRAALASINDADNYVKIASLYKEAEPRAVNEPANSDAGPKHKYVAGTIAGIGLLTLALMGASAVGSYRYNMAADPGNLAYNAMKQGLNEYARNKAYSSNVTIVPENGEEYFRNIDEGQPDKNTRELPEKQPTRKPISVTL